VRVDPIDPLCVVARLLISDSVLAIEKSSLIFRRAREGERTFRTAGAGHHKLARGLHRIARSIN